MFWAQISRGAHRLTHTGCCITHCAVTSHLVVLREVSACLYTTIAVRFPVPVHAYRLAVLPPWSPLRCPPLERVCCTTPSHAVDVLSFAVLIGTCCIFLMTALPVIAATELHVVLTCWWDCCHHVVPCACYLDVIPPFSCPTSMWLCAAARSPCHTRCSPC